MYEEKLTVIANTPQGVLVEELSAQQLQDRFDGGYFGEHPSCLEDIPSAKPELWPVGTLLVMEETTRRTPPFTRTAKYRGYYMKWWSSPAGSGNLWHKVAYFRSLDQEESHPVCAGCGVAFRYTDLEFTKKTLQDTAFICPGVLQLAAQPADAVSVTPM